MGIWQFPSPSRLKFKNNKRTFLFLGVLIQWKGLNVIMERVKINLDFFNDPVHSPNHDEHIALLNVVQLRSLLWKQSFINLWYRACIKKQFERCTVKEMPRKSRKLFGNFRQKVRINLGNFKPGVTSRMRTVFIIDSFQHTSDGRF